MAVPPCSMTIVVSIISVIAAVTGGTRNVPPNVESIEPSMIRSTLY